MVFGSFKTLSNSHTVADLEDLATNAVYRRQGMASALLSYAADLVGFVWSSKQGSRAAGKINQDSALPGYRADGECKWGPQDTPSSLLGKQRRFYARQGFNEVAHFETPAHPMGQITVWVLVKEREAKVGL
jgi:GNAT superfamily N-acetyltransferase